jgi:alpha-N-arabinofuranosidase
MDEPLYTPNWSFEDDFSADKLHPRWSWLRNPDMSKYSFEGRGVTLHGGKDSLNDMGLPTFLGTRQQQFDASYETKITVSGESGCAGITVFHTNEHHYDLLVKKQDSGLSVQLRRRVADMEVVSEPTVFENTDTLTLKIEAERLLYSFFAGRDKEHLTKIGTGSSQLLSTEVMLCTYTGCFVGMFAEGEVKADFTFFRMTDK